MHNGVVGSFAKLKRTLAARLSDTAYSRIQGTTDSEHLFGLFCDHHSQVEAPDETDAMAAALEATISDVVALASEIDPQRISHLNLAASDGTRAVVSRYSTGEESPSLYISTGRECVCESGVCRMIQAGGEASSVIVASEPLNDDAGWEPVPHNHLLVIHPDRSMDCRPIG